ncbi:MAG: TetR/AcrR family transcriptional regulator [Aquificaceae bacterium]
MRRKNTKEKILEASLKLFSQKGIRETTIKDIAKEVGVTEGAIYRHLESKEEIVLGLFKTYSEDLYNRLVSAFRGEASFERVFHKTISAFLSFCFKKSLRLKYLNLFHYLKPEDIGKFSPLPRDALLKLIEEGIRQGRVKVKKDYALAVLVGTLERVFILTETGLLKREEVRAEEVAYIIGKALS